MTSIDRINNAIRERRLELDRAKSEIMQQAIKGEIRGLEIALKVINEQAGG